MNAHMKFLMRILHSSLCKSTQACPHSFQARGEVKASSSQMGRQIPLTSIQNKL